MEIKKAGLKNALLKVFIFGKPKTGKSYFASTFPSPIFFNTDGNVAHLKADYSGEKDYVSYIDLETTEENFAHKEALTFLQNPEIKKFKTIVIDLVSDFIDKSIEREVLIKSGMTFTRAKGETAQSQNDFGATTSRVKKAFENWIVDLINIANSNNQHIIFLAHTQEKSIINSKKELVTKITSSINNKLHTFLASRCNINAMLENQTNLIFDSLDVEAGTIFNLASGSYANYEALTKAIEKGGEN